MAALNECCRQESGRSLKKHRDVAVCDGCGHLLLGYGNERDYELTRVALGENGIAFCEGRVGTLEVISKPRAG